ncbi:hypothetical protein FRX31_012986 [Thalictrum thalictroides]|uniref:Uncharacterized protein n=1 Tax=Thalictrum thalictroides TaxID=46969 RepID=A0A7J6WJ65_THATH|nr:hypothetical protein FRX31_012986 [Thalictrum thalictroides]
MWCREVLSLVSGVLLDGFLDRTNGNMIIALLQHWRWDKQDLLVIFTVVKLCFRVAEICCNCKEIDIYCKFTSHRPTVNFPLIITKTISKTKEAKSYQPIFLILFSTLGLEN